MSAQRLTPLLVGACPTEWKQPYIEELTDLLTNGFVGTSLPHQTENSETGIRYLQGFNVRPNKLDLTRTTWVTHDFHAKNRKSQLREGDVLVVQSGHIGTAAVVSKEAAGSNCHAVIICRFNPEIVDPDFASQYLNSSIGQARLRGLHVGSSLPHINTSELGRFKLPLPPLHEQRKLAELWVTWDTAIQKAEQLIAAKERYYSGLIGRLINGRSKSEAWRHVSIRDIADRVQRQGDGGDYPLLTISSASGFIRQEERYSRYMAGESAKTYTLLRAGEFSYNKGNSKRYEFGCVFQLQNYNAALVPSVYVSFRLHDSICAAYMRHLFVADYLKPQLRALVKTGVRNNGLLNISPDEFLSAKIPLPPLDQQIKIAQALDAASEDIDLLKRQLSALRVQKRGLMQKLLTGQWRLKVDRIDATTMTKEISHG
jgi:type I restriction enzyme S subunit